MKIVLISGKSGSGKDLIAESSKKYLEEKGKKCLIIKFGDVLKAYLKSFFDWNGEKDETGRALLQETGEGFKTELADSYYWADRLCEILKYKNSLEKYDFVFIPDCRFIEELECITSTFGEKKVKFVRVERPDMKSKLSEKQQKHISEIEFDDFEFFDLVISTDSVEEKNKKMFKFLDELL